MSYDSAPYPLMSRAPGFLPGPNPVEHQGAYNPPTRSLKNTEGYLTAPSASAPLNIALDYMKGSAGALGLTDGDLSAVKVTDLYTDANSGTTHIYLRQQLNGLEVSNALASANVDRQGRLINVSTTFVHDIGQSVGYALANPALSATQALLAAAPGLGLNAAGAPIVVATAGGASQSATLQVPGLSLDPIPTKLQYVATPGGAELAWNYILRTPDGDHWYDFSVSAEDASPVAISDWIDHASYNVFAMPLKDPDDGPRTIVTDVHDPIASPFGWHDTDGAVGAEFTDTRGNNVSAQEDTDDNDTGGNRPDGGTELVFDFPLNLGQAPSTYQDAAITNLFYLNNVIHDIHYKYGFDEASGNFQVNNYGKGGVGDDAVQADAQDGSGVNNANFGTPPDGFAPRMQMFVFDLTSPNRDGDLDSQIVIHEYGHGVSNRLTGGPANANALNAVQSGGMGEGWSDWWSLMLLQLPTDGQMDAYATGNYVLGQPATGGGIRRFPYSYDMSINPQTIGDFNGGFPNNESHNVGEIWCSVLWDMNWLLIEKYGFDADIAQGYTGEDSAGNLLAMQLVMDALKLQPANPSFLEARDAILQADVVLTGGANKVEIWTAFARRGMGLSFVDSSSNATTVTPGFDLPIFYPLVSGVAPLTGQVGSPTAFDNITVATFIDVPSDPPGGYVATINWGDGTVSTGTITQSGSSYTVKGSHVYDDFGTYKMTVSVRNPRQSTLSANNTVTVTDAPIVGSSTTITGNEGVAISQAVATFTSANVNAIPSQFTATIRWGDNISTPGIITALPGGGFSVQGTHLYRQGGNFDVNVSIISKGGTRTTVLSRAEVADSPITTASVSATATESIAFAGTIATYIDQAPDGGLVGDFRAQVDWGDNSPLTTATIVFQGPGYAVNAAHTYTRFGTFPAKVIITNSTGSASYTVNSTVTVSDAPLTGSAVSVATTAGSTFSGIVASFLDTNITGVASDLSATINWGNGRTSPGVVSSNGAGRFLVSGENTFRDPGSSQVTVTLTSVGGTSPAPIVTTARIADAPLRVSYQGIAAGPANNPGASSPGLTLPLGLGFAGALATFTTTDPFARAEEYLVTINWGDNTRSTGVLVPNGSPTSGGFTVNAEHVYASAGTFPISIDITSRGGLVTKAPGAGRILQPLNGRIDAGSDTGVSNADGVTSNAQVLFRGASDFNANVTLYARPADGSGGVVKIGEAVADASGNWALVNDQALADGRYLISAVASDIAGRPIQTTEFGLGSMLTIDKTGPLAADVRLDPAKGRATIYFKDDGSGVVPAALLDPQNYRLILPGKRGTSTFATLAVTPLPQLSGGGLQAVLVSFRVRGRMGNGGYVLSINSNNVADLAGNTLFERTYVAFPQLSNVPNNAYIAQIDVQNGRASAPRPYVPLPEIIAAQNYSSKVRRGTQLVRIRARARR